MQQSLERTSHEDLDSPDMSFSDPVEVHSSYAESFDEVEMYGMDYEMEPVSQSSDESDDEHTGTSQSHEGRIVRLCIIFLDMLKN